MSYEEEQDEGLEFPCKIIRSTDKAYLCAFDDEDGKGKTDWIPISQIIKEEKIKDSSLVRIFIPEWLAEKKGLI